MKQNNKAVVCYTDGGARGNPGPAGIGVVIKSSDGTDIKKINEYIGDNITNNIAEYCAVIRLFEELIKLKIKTATVNLDSELVVNQLTGNYRVKDEKLKLLAIKVKTLENQLESVSYHYIPREQNKEADKLVNIALNLNIK